MSDRRESSEGNPRIERQTTKAQLSIERRKRTQRSCLKCVFLRLRKSATPPRQNQPFRLQKAGFIRHARNQPTTLQTGCRSAWAPEILTAASSNEKSNFSTCQLDSQLASTSQPGRDTTPLDVRHQTFATLNTCPLTSASKHSVRIECATPTDCLYPSSRSS